MIRLFIKGTVEQATAALQRHKLWDHAKGLKERKPLYTTTECCDCEVPETDQLKVVNWYCENMSTPYPPGTLLHYKHDEVARV